MKHLSKILLVLFVLASTTGFSQNLKFGHINSEELISLMPDRDSALVKLQKANETITSLGKQRGLIYIFDTSSGAIPFINAELSEDILPLAKTALKIPADKKPMAIGGQPAQ